MIHRRYPNTPGQSNGNEEVLFPKSSRTGASPSDGFVSYLGYSFEGLTPM